MLHNHLNNYREWNAFDNSNIFHYELNKDNTSSHANMNEVSGRAHEASALHKEMKTTKECWEEENQSSPGKSTPVDHPTPNGQPWKPIYTSNSM